MTDVFTPEKRSAVMSRVKNRDTAPEILVRSLLHRMGYRFRLQVKDLPGTPDIVLPKYRSVIFVHGCFWHGHEGCPRSQRPQANAEFWNEKIGKNMARDEKAQDDLRAIGWRVLIVWQCRTRKTDELRQTLEEFLTGAKG